MDHLHEELKQPVSVADEDPAEADNENSMALKFPAPSRHFSTSAALDCEAAAEPSDTDYETCDSGLSSESNSVVVDMSPRGDDEDEITHGDLLNSRF